MPYITVGKENFGNIDLGVPGAATCALPLKTMEQAIALRNRIPGCFERAAQEEDP